MYGICILSQIPCRKEPSDRSEMVTQLLFGESYEVVSEKAKWFQIKTAYDNYDCWISENQFFPIAKSTFDVLNNFPQACTCDLAQVIKNKSDNSVFPVVCGSTLPNYKDGVCKIEEMLFAYDGLSSGTLQSKNIRTELIESAYIYMNSPYLWGGRSPFGIDCSGFTQVIYKMNGIKLPRDASQQASFGETLNFIEEAQSGDLAFFDNEEGNIIHVGIILSEGNIIHASGCVRIDKLDHHGIYNTDQKLYTHNLRVINRIIKPGS